MVGSTWVLGSTELMFFLQKIHLNQYMQLGKGCFVTNVNFVIHIFYNPL